MSKTVTTTEMAAPSAATTGPASQAAPIDVGGATDRPATKSTGRSAASRVALIAGKPTTRPVKTTAKAAVHAAAVTPDSFRQLSHFLRVLTDASNLALITRLQFAGELSAGDLALSINSTVSGQASRLRSLGLVGFIRSRRDGKHVMYSVVTERVKDIVGNLGEVVGV